MAGEDKKDKENGLVTALKQGSEDQIKSINETTTNIDNEMGTQATHLADIVTGWNNRLNESTEEAKLQQSQDRTRTAFAGVTEFANALTNLLGTTRNAKHQVQKTYTADWMQQADNHRKYYKEERQRLEQQKNAAQNDLDKLNLMREQLKASAQQQIASLQADTGVKVAQTEQEQVRYEAAQERQNKLDEDASKQAWARIRETERKDKESERLRQMKIRADVEKTIEKNQSQDKLISLGTDEDGEPIYRVGNPTEIGNIVKSMLAESKDGKPVINDLDEEGKKTYDSIDWNTRSQEDKAKAVMDLIPHSKMLQDRISKITRSPEEYLARYSQYDPTASIQAQPVVNPQNPSSSSSVTYDSDGRINMTNLYPTK